MRKLAIAVAVWLLAVHRRTLTTGGAVRCNRHSTARVANSHDWWSVCATAGAAMLEQSAFDQKRRQALPSSSSTLKPGACTCTVRVRAPRLLCSPGMVSCCGGAHSPQFRAVPRTVWRGLLQVFSPPCAPFAITGILVLNRRPQQRRFGNGRCTGL